LNQKLELIAKERRITGKQVHRLRREGLVPAVLYGNGAPSLPLQIEREALQQLLHREGRSTLLQLKLDGRRATTALVKQVQYHPTSGELLHVDFQRVGAREKLKARVPLHFVGEAPAVGLGNVVIVRSLDEMQVECYPADLPAALEVDLSQLHEPGSAIRVKDLHPGSKVTILDQPDQVVASAAATRKELAEVPAAPVEQPEEAAAAPERAAGVAEEGLREAA